VNPALALFFQMMLASARASIGAFAGADTTSFVFDFSLIAIILAKSGKYSAIAGE
jgi:hypothetical protein